MPLSLLKGIDAARDTLLANTQRFARGLPANNALLWGARGMGKSSLVKAVHGEVAGLKLVEIHREDISSLPHLLAHLRAAPEHALHPVLRRPFLRGARHVLQIAEGGARRRHRGPARQCAVLCHLEPAASDAARDGRERALDRHQSRRSGRGEALAVGSFRLVDRLPQLQPGRLSRRWCAPMPAITACGIADESSARGSAGLGDLARQPLGPRRLAIYPGPRRPAWASRFSATRRWPPRRSCIWSDRRGASPCAARNEPAAGSPSRWRRPWRWSGRG